MNFRNLENTKRKAHLVKWRSMENLDKLLPEFESNAIRKGMKVIWANDEEEAQTAISELLKKHEIRSVHGESTPIMSEINLSTLLEKEQVQLSGSPTTTETDALEERTEFRADATIRSVHFLIAETGSLAVSDGENDVAQKVFPRVQIYLAGIEDIIPSFQEIELFWPLLDSYLPAERPIFTHSILSGRQIMSPTKELTEVYVVLLDNGRSDLLAKIEQRQGLYCIHCEACLRVCPIYQHMGPESYRTVYTGPIGSLITPHTRGMKEFKHLSDKTTLCGKCTEVCPVNIDISRMLLVNRRDAVREGHAATSEKFTWRVYTRIVGQRKWMDFFSVGFKNFMLRLFLRKKWGKKRTLPTFRPRSRSL